MQRQFDIVIVGDLRFPGGTSSAIATELSAQARAGYRTALVALKSPVLRFPHPISPRLRAALDAGQAELVDPETPISAGLLLLHHPQALTHLPVRPLRIVAATGLLIVHHPPLDGYGAPFYDWRTIALNAAAVAGRPPLWAPVGPQVRRQLEGLPDGPPLLEDDWHNLLEPAAWQVERRPPAGGTPVLGRHSRPDLMKWPASRAEALEIYPATDHVRVAALGVDAAIAEFLAPVPTNWRVLPFGDLPARDFLAGLDAYLYYHHPRWIEAFGIGVAEALATGLPAVLPPAFAPLFGAGALYAEPAEAAAITVALCAEPERWRRQAEAGRALVAERFAARHHAPRLHRLIGPPTAVGRRRPERRRRVLFFTSNGVGLGHLTRLLAIAKRCPPDIEPIFLTLSQAARLIEEAGFTTEYLPFHAYLGADVRRWNNHLVPELTEIIRFYGAGTVVFDGNTPYGGLTQVLQKLPQLWSAWVRRGFWRPGSGAAALEREASFDVVIEPSDLAAIVDRGPTTHYRARTRTVAPVRLLDPAERLDRDAARAALDLPAEATCVLLQLGSGNNFDYAAMRAHLLAKLAAVPGLVLAALEWPISDRASELPPEIRPLRLFPASRYFAAFDFVVSAAGYNSFHELLLAGVPTLFVPNENPTMDDQRARAEQAERMGWALSLRADDLYGAGPCLERLLDPDERAAIHARLALLPQDNGAVEAARIVTEMTLTLRADRALG